MWKLIEISQQTHFIHCSFTSSQEVTFILYDLKETWCETLAFNEVKKKVKLLNKRLDFSEQNIKETLNNGELQTAIVEQQPHTSSTKQESCLIKLKYRVKNCPFNLEWSLRRQTLEEFQSTFMQPLFTALLGCFQQVGILTDTLRKKDAELSQYRKEGAVLHRKTLATKPFDFDDFNMKYKTSTELAENFTELAKFVINTKPKVQVTTEETKQEIPAEERPNTTNNTNTKMSPKQRKRKGQEMKQQLLERQLKNRKELFEYESSQSQTTNYSSNSQSNEETLEDAEEDKRKNLRDRSKGTITTTPSKKEIESDSDHNSSPRRRSTRCTPTKNYTKIDFDDDKTDSENDNCNLRSLREGNSIARNLNTKESEKSPNTDQKDKTIENNKTNESTSKKESTDKLRKSPNLSYNKNNNTPTKSTDKSSESSNNIYDFSTDSEYEVASKIRKKSETTSASDAETRKTRSSPQVSKYASQTEVVTPNKSLSPNLSLLEKTKNLSHSSTPNVSEEIFSQLDAIKKELECLEALRIADLQERMLHDIL